MLDEDGGVIRARASIEALSGALRERIVFDEVLLVRATAAGTVEVRAGGASSEHGRVVVCAGRGTAALARGAGLPLPLRHAAHVRLTYAVRGDPPPRLACLLDASGAFGEPGGYGDPLPGNGAYAVGLDDTPVHDDGSLIDAGGLAAIAERTTAYVEPSLPGVHPEPVDARHCWVTELPVAPGRVRRLGGRRPADPRRQPPVQARACDRARAGSGRRRRRPRAELAPGGQARRGVVRDDPQVEALVSGSGPRQCDAWPPR